MIIGKQEFDFTKRSYIMGILNVTPDSFSDGGRFNNLEAAIQRGLELEAEGADILDIGGESTKPGGADYVSPEEEIRRITGPIRELSSKLNIPISIDTYKGDAAEAALKAGAAMVNDVTGLFADEKLGRVVAHYGVPVCIMMNRRLIEPSGDVLKDLDLFYSRSFELARKYGIREDQLILDPGIGFGLAAEESFSLLRHLAELKKYGMPILLGTSRKRIIWQTLGVEPTQGMAGTLATTAIGIMNGANIIRVHDVKENVDCARIAEAILFSK